MLTAFADEGVNALLGVDPAREVALAIVCLGRAAPAPPPAPEVEPLSLKIEPYSPREIDYPPIAAAHRASCLASGDEAAVWRQKAVGLLPAGGPEPGPEPEPDGTAWPLPAPVKLDLSSPALAAVIRRRGSSRRFARAPITLSRLSTILDLVLAPIPADFTPMVDLYVIVHAVEGLDAGAYAVDRDRRILVPLHRGNFRQQAGFLALGQPLAADAAINLYSLVALPSLVAQLGNRGYRVAQLEGGVIGGRVYLGTTALGLGATGLTFFDDYVTELLLAPRRRQERDVPECCRPSGPQAPPVDLTPRPSARTRLPSPSWPPRVSPVRTTTRREAEPSEGVYVVGVTLP